MKSFLGSVSKVLLLKATLTGDKGLADAVKSVGKLQDMLGKGQYTDIFGYVKAVGPKLLESMRGCSVDESLHQDDSEYVEDFEERDPEFVRSMIDIFVKEGKYDAALNYFQSHRLDDVVLFRFLIDGLIEGGNYKHVLWCIKDFKMSNYVLSMPVSDKLMRVDDFFSSFIRSAIDGLIKTEDYFFAFRYIREFGLEREYRVFVERYQADTAAMEG